MMSRIPNRLPLDDQASQSSTKAVLASQDSVDNGVETEMVTQSKIQEMLRKKLGLEDPGNVLIYDEFEEDADDDDDLIFEEVDEDEAAKIGTDKFKTPDCRIKTHATIVVQRREQSTPQSSLLSVLNRKAIIKVPPSKVKETLNQRFHRLQNRMMKRSLTQEQALFNYLKMRGEAGYQKAFGHRSGLIKKLKTKLGERAKLQAEGGKRKVMTDKILSEIAEASAEDHESFWRKQVRNWIENYEWKKHDGPDFSKEELDQQIEEWMSMKGKIFETAEEMVEDIDNFMQKKGFVRADAEQLDAELDDYWSKKGQKMHDDDDDKASNSVKTFNSGNVEKRGTKLQAEKNVDADLDTSSERKNSSGLISESGSPESLPGSTKPGWSTGNSSVASKIMTPAQRIQMMQEKRRQNLSTEKQMAELEEDIDIYFKRREILKQREKQAEEAAKKAAEEARKKQLEEEMAMCADDKFADDQDFEMFQ